MYIPYIYCNIIYMYVYTYIQIYHIICMCVMNLQNSSRYSKTRVTFPECRHNFFLSPWGMAVLEDGFKALC